MADASNIELLRRGFEIYEHESVEGLLSLADPEIEIHTHPGLMSAGIVRGHEGLEIRGGKVTRIHLYFETDGALEAAKLLAAEP